MDGKEIVAVGNSLGRAPWGRSGMERDGSEDVVDGGETVRNSVGRAPLGRSKMEVTTGWTEDDGREGVGHSLGGAPWGRGEMEATSKLDGGEIVGNSMGREGSDVRGTEGIGWESSVGKAMTWKRR